MRIPFYNARVQPTSEAPGRSITSRKNSSLAVQTALDKGAPVSEALTQIGEYSRMRYEMARENLLNEATLGAEEQIFNAYREFQQYGSPNTQYAGLSFNKVLDGDDPLWNKRMNKIKKEMKTKLGKDKYTNNKFDAFFAQSELRNKFKLRGVIDTKVKAAAAKHRSMKLQNAVTKHGNKNIDYNDFVFERRMLATDRNTMLKFKIDGKTVYNEADLSNQEKAITYDVAELALTDYAFDPNNDNPLTPIEDLRTVVFANQKENIDVKFSDLDNKGKEIVKLLNDLPTKQKIKIFSDVSRLAGVVNAPTFEEIEAENEAKLLAKLEKESKKEEKETTKNLREVSNVELTNINLQIDNLTTDYTELNENDIEQFEDTLIALQAKAEVYEKTLGEPFQSSTLYQNIRKARIQLNEQKTLLQSHNQFYSLNNFNEMTVAANNEELAKTSFGQKVQKLFVDELQSTVKAATDGDLIDHIVNKKRIKEGMGFGGAEYQKFNMSMLQDENEQNLLGFAKKARTFGRFIHTQYHPDASNSNTPIQFLDSESATNIKNEYHNETAIGKMSLLKKLIGAFDNDFDDVLEQIGVNPNMFVAARLVQENTKTAIETANHIMIGSERRSNNQKNSFITPSVKNDVLHVLRSAFLPSGHDMLPNWLDAAESHATSYFDNISLENFEDAALTEDDKKTTGRNQILFSMSKIFDATMSEEIATSTNLQDIDSLPFADAGGFQTLNNRIIFVPNGISAENISNNLDNLTKFHLEKSSISNVKLDGSFVYHDETGGILLSDKALKDIKDNSDQYFLLADTQGRSMLVRSANTSKGYTHQRDANGDPIFLDLNRFGKETMFVDRLAGID